MLQKPVGQFEVEMYAEGKDTTYIESRYEFLRAHSGVRPKCLHGLMSSTGCLSGDSVILANRGGGSRRYKLRELCIKFGNYPGLWHKKGFKDIDDNCIRSYIESEGIIGLKKYIDVVYSGIKETYELKLRCGFKIRATLDHKIQTDKGMVQLGDLNTDSMVMVDSYYNATSKDGKRKKMADLYLVVGKYHKHCITINSKAAGVFRRVQKHRAIYEARLNGMTIREFQEATKSPNNLKFVNTKKDVIHHKNNDHYDNDPDNLVSMDRIEHCRHHSKENRKNFNQGGISYSQVKSIEYFGREETFDVIEVSSTHNFVANNIVVSNSGKTTLLKGIIAETAVVKKCLIWITEESIVEYQELINYMDKSCLKNIVFVEEKKIPEEFKVDHATFTEYFSQMVEESGCDIVFIDNITSSAFYNQRFGFAGQNKTAEFFMNFVKNVCAVFYIAHTQSNITENHNKIVTSEDIRGSKELAIVTEYFYIIQKFTTNGKIYNILKVAKFRHHENAAGYYALAYEKRTYIGDAKIPFTLMNSIFKGRDYLGRAAPKKDKDPESIAKRIKEKEKKEKEDASKTK